MRTHSIIEQVKKRFGIIGHSSLLNQQIEVAVQVAATHMNVLLHGESGSGKESFAQIIHYLSPRKHAKMITVNCGAIPPGTIDSELFGHEKGAFTGAEGGRKGYFEEADGGTIFLDELGELPLGAQARLLRILESQEYLRVGSSQVRKTDVRVVAATHQNLQQAIHQKKFREDLYYRINTVPIPIPPLRKRGRDILLLFKEFATQFARRYHAEPIQLSEKAEKRLLTYHFPGNIRQLKSIAEQVSLLAHQKPIIATEELDRFLPLPAHPPAVALSKEEPLSSSLLYQQLWQMQKDIAALKRLWRLHFHHDKQSNGDVSLHSLPPLLPAQLSDHSLPWQVDAVAKTEMKASLNSSTPQNLSLEKKEKELIQAALAKNKGDRKKSAKDLGISIRTLYRRIREYNLEKKG